MIERVVLTGSNNDCSAVRRTTPLLIGALMMAEPWNLPERQVTPEPVVLSRRRWLKWAIGSGLVAAGAGTGALWWYRGGSDRDVLANGYVGAAPELYPALRNPAFAEVDRPVTEEAEAARYTNYYEFSISKNVWRYVEDFKPLPWRIEVTGLVAKPKTYDIDDLLHAFPLEERIYRHRCVETWAMVVPWTGFPLAALLRKAEPLPSAKYVKFLSFHRPEEAGGQQRAGFPWPYNEGLTLAEAANPLTFVATGMYGHPLLKQHGAPIRLVLPWKYGFKSPKTIVRIELTDTQPATFWNTVAPQRYGFASNVDPADRQQGYSQQFETMLGTDERRQTLLYNGYGEWVSDLYTR